MVPSADLAQDYRFDLVRGDHHAFARLAPTRSEQNLDRLRNSPRRRTLVSDHLARSAQAPQPILI
jgi:hypothetical protein